MLRSGVPQHAIGVYVQEIGAVKPTLTINADQAMNPASVMKLLTTYAGLELLGPAYTWPTRIFTHGKLSQGILQGDLVIKGYGDPRLDLGHFWSLIYQLRQAGLQNIQGNLILDRTHYEIPHHDPGDFDGKPYRSYNALPEALMVNYRATTLHFFPQSENNTVRVVLDPESSSLRIQSHLQLTQGSCGDWRNAVTTDILPDEANKNHFTIIAGGKFSTQCGKQSVMLSLQDSVTYIQDVFKRLWAEQGGKFSGYVVEASTPHGAILLDTYSSLPLAEIVRGINKYSNNIAARQLYLALGTGKDMLNNSPATLEKSHLAMQNWLHDKRLNFPELVVENGSGLSRKERISARHMGKILTTAYQSPVMSEFMSSLPIAATDGTLKNRFADTAAKGRAHLKTGALDNVRALAGYVLDRMGRRHVIVFFVNHSHAEKSRSVMDALVQWIVERPQ
ncbi:D-alanyl-D-alanine carboxypeptidase / D-alanyl-D-alanine-endopeptidase (penicillin-binding protein 4) [Nitrosomonas sp. PY1]|nr:D-alanyl-D-alanine carboxypeptidase / D-alanyl-D-alanine-endopeptidase (penicillin-binding protein 4) [Nitrosomonas sp. PY1]